MFGIRFIKSQPTVHLMQFRAGKVVREGAGQSSSTTRPPPPWWPCPWAARTATSCWNW
jgi:hypothetical protein